MREASGEPAGRSLSQRVLDRASVPSSSTSADASPRRMRAKTFVSLLGTFESTRGFPIWLADARSENRLADQRLAACTTWRRCSGLSSIEAWPSRSSCRASREALHRSAGGLLSGTSAAAKAIVSILIAAQSGRPVGAARMFELRDIRDETRAYSRRSACVRGPGAIR